MTQQRKTCPWYISAHAVRRYLALMRRPGFEGGPEWNKAEDELMQMAERVALNVASGATQPKPIRPGLLKYRGPRPLRLGLIVSTDPRPEGPLPQLVDVMPSNASGGVGAGRKKLQP